MSGITSGRVKPTAASFGSSVPSVPNPPANTDRPIVLPQVAHASVHELPASARMREYSANLERLRKYVSTANERLPAREALLLRAVWWEIEARVRPSFAPLPTISRIDDEAIELEWNDSRHHLTLDVYQDGIEWFHVDRVTGERSGEDRRHVTIPDCVYEVLRRIHE